MLKNYELDDEELNILDELDGLCGVVQNKETLKNMIIYAKLRQDGKINLGNFNIIIRNDSSYNILEDLLKVCSKVLLKYNIITNNKICYLDKLVNSKRESVIDKIICVEEDIIVINDRKMRMDYTDEIENIKKFASTYNNKIFVFVDSSWIEGDADAKLGDVATWRFTINKITLEDKIVYCKKMLDENSLKYRSQDVKDFANCPMWQLKVQLMQLIVECKSSDIVSVSTEMFKKNTTAKREKESKRSPKKKDNGEIYSKQELNDLVGLKEIKEQVEKIMNYVKLNKKRGNLPMLHMCFTGNPGTGKTSIARIIGKLFSEANILPGNGDFTEIHGRDLIDQFVGWTAPKVKSIIEDSIGGVLFIDEAYSLISDRRGGYEDEAIATLIKEMEDHRDEICIILAGYTKEMEELLKQNPGFQSRIQFHIEFPDYSEEELLEIFNRMCKKEKYKLAKGCSNVLLDTFHRAKQEESFGNGRYARNLFEKIKFEQANRIAKTNSKSLDSITKEDIFSVINNEQRKESKKTIGFQIE